MRLHLVLMLIAAWGCTLFATTRDYTQYVNPMIGTGGHGHTFPGPVVPHGMIQPGPDTRMLGWDASSGYHYSDSTINGFSHTHLSGTGIGDYGDILIMPTVGPQDVRYEGATTQQLSFASAFSHNNETATPGYYKVFLKRYQVYAELTATARAAIHRYTFPASDQSGFVLDLDYSIVKQANKDLYLEVIGDSAIRGRKNSQGWAWDHQVCFYAEFSKPFKYTLIDDTLLVDGRSLPRKKALLQFITHDNEEVLMRIGISSVDMDGAQRNLKQEIPDWNFERVRSDAKNAWNHYLSRIHIETNESDHREIFYTALYHAGIAPYLHSDVDGRFRGMDQKIHQATPENPRYTVFSLWDTFRALHPLYTIIDPRQNSRFIASLLSIYREGGILPMWELAGNYTGTMIGYHAVPVIVDAWLKGDRSFDPHEALAACIRSSEYSPEGIHATRYVVEHGLMPVSKYYKNKLGYIPFNVEVESVAKGLEYAYNDWCIARFAESLGRDDIRERYDSLAQLYKNYFDPSTGFMRGKDDQGKWRTPFHPRASDHRTDDYCEGTAWQWTWFVPHDVPGLKQLMGGREAFVNKLDSLFLADSSLEGELVSADISGLIGQYAHGNEPSHHIIHMYNEVGLPWKTQELADSIMRSLYHAHPDGLSGNEDCGQMSAWYILNAMGFYQTAPGRPVYSIGRPMFDKVTIQLEENRQFTILTHNNSRRNKYISTVKLNGTLLDSPYFTHVQLMQGGVLEITMTDEPSKWGEQQKSIVDYVNPFIGTTNYGTTNPGAVMPNGLMSVVPFNVMGSENNRFDKDRQWWSTPYEYNNYYFTGFSHVNLSGVGCPDLGTLLLMPTTGPLNVDYRSYGSDFARESASPGYYSNFLTRYGITSEVTATMRTGRSRFRFPAGRANILLNLGEGLTNETGATVRFVGDDEIEGIRMAGTFCYTPQKVFPIYFVMKIHKKPHQKGYWKKMRPMGVEAQWDIHADRYKVYDSYSKELSGDDIGAWFSFDLEFAQTIEVSLGVSFVSIENARLNLQTEQEGISFNQIHDQAKSEWENLLSRIKVSGGTDDQKSVFYTALYRTLIHPNILQDVNGDYPAMESNKILNTKSNRYTVFSLWDTYRNVHQLLTLLYPERQMEMIQTMLEMYREHGWLPKWELFGRETLTMEGDPAIPVIVDSWMKGLRDFDVELAYEAMLKSATTPGAENLLRPDNDDYMTLGYVPLRQPYDNSVSHALEYYVADNALADFAAALGKKSDMQLFRNRSRSYHHYFSPEYGTLRPKLPDGSFYAPFNPLQGENFEPSPGFHEGNAWNYTFYVPHDIPGLVRLMGGRQKFVSSLQNVFDQGWYDPTNEPDIAYPYLFSYFPDEAWRTQKQVRSLLQKHYTNHPAGLPGNDDAGTMSAWAAFSMMGFYPDIPGVAGYTITTPVFDSVSIQLNPQFHGQQELKIIAERNNEEDQYIQSMTLGGKALKRFRVSHEELLKGGELRIKLKPEKE